MPAQSLGEKAVLKAPELIAPAGDWDCAKAAVENGADGIYFGLRSGLNARARAVNFSSEELPELMTYLRRRGVKGYLTLNTLLFPEELEAAEASIRLAAASGVDAIIVQDLGMLRLAKQVCPSLPLHASTQMTLGSAECIAQVASICGAGVSPDRATGTAAPQEHTQAAGTAAPQGYVSRVVLPRELSLKEIAAIHRQTPVELEVFVHGALCISYSGQCLASLALGGRSGNRGQCAQACRLPYELMVAEIGNSSDQNTFVDEKKYLYSPCDLAAFELLPEMIAAGISALKIEGRLKEADYVAVVTRFYRRAMDEAVAGRRVDFSREEIAELEAAFSRGFSHGWLDGPNPQKLVTGDSSSKRGVLLGEVRGVRGDRVRIALDAAVHRGVGVVFEGGRETGEEQGGRIFEIFANGRSVEDVGQISNLSSEDATKPKNRDNSG